MEIVMGELVMVKYHEPETVSAGGITLMEAEVGPRRADILGAGEEVPLVKAGDLVLMNNVAGTKYQHPKHGEVYYVAYQAILAKL